MYELNEGEAVLVFPNQVHSLQSVESEHTLCIFSPEIVKAYSNKVLAKLPQSNRFTVDENTLKLFDGLFENTTDVFRKGVLYLICAAFDKNAVYKHQDAQNKSLLQKIFAFVDNNFEHECSLRTLSANIGYNYSYLSRYFKNVVGISFNTYVNDYRLNNACYLLKNSSDTVLQCALNSGFVSLRTFNRDFRKSIGITPLEYRKLQNRI